MRDHQIIIIHPTGCWDMGIKIPANTRPIFVREKGAVIDIKPKELKTFGLSVQQHLSHFDHENYVVVYNEDTDGCFG